MTLSRIDTRTPVSQYVLKFYEDGVKQRLKADAALNDRSMNAEIIYLIKRGQEAVKLDKQGAMYASQA